VSGRTKVARLALFGAVLAVACGGGGGGGGGGPTQPTPGISYAPSNGSANLALVEAAGSGATTLRLDLRAQQVTGLYGVAFDLVYPSDLFTFGSVTEGSFLAGATTSLQVEETGAGRLVVGLSRLGAVGGVSGNGTLLTVELRSRGSAGTGALAFEKNSAFDGAGKAIAGVSWSGGSATVVP
jgi:hypothetical protein